MNKKVLFAGLALTLPFLVLFAQAFGRDPFEVQSPLLGRQAPPFSLVPVSGTEPVSLDSLKGKPVLLNFWATWCEPCRMEHRVLQQGARIFGDRVQFVGIVYEDKPETILDFLARHGSGYPALVDAGGKTAIAYGVGGVPETFFIDASGTVVAKYNGPLSARMLEGFVQRLLGGGS